MHKWDGKIRKKWLKVKSFHSVKTSSTKKAKVKNRGYSLGEYLYVSSRQVLILRHKTYSTVPEDEDLLKWESKQ